MSIEVHAVQRAKVYVEGTFGADSSASLASFTDLPIREGSAQMTLTIDSLDPQQNVQSRVEYREEVLGKRSATLTFTLNLAPTGVAAGNGIVSVASGLGILLKAALGGEWLDQGTTCTTGSSATAVKATDTGAAAQFPAGGVLGWVNSSSILEVREIESVSGNTITLKHALSGSPANNDVLYNAATYYMTEDPSQSLAMWVAGRETQDQWLLTGGQVVGGFTVAIDPSGAALPSVTFNMTFARWFSQAEMASPAASIGNATYTHHSPIVGHAGEFRVWTVGASTLSTSTRVHASAIAYTPKVAFVPVTSPSGTNTVYRWRASRAAPPVEGSFTTVFEDLTWWTARGNKTDHDVQYTMGQTAGSTVVLSAPTVQIVNPQRVADGQGLAAQTIAWKGRRDTDVGSSTSALAKSPFRIHLI